MTPMLSLAQEMGVVLDSVFVSEQVARIDRLHEQVKSLTTTVNGLQRTLNQQVKNQETIGESVNSLSGQLGETKASLQSTSESLQGEIEEAKEYADEIGNSTNQMLTTRTWIGCVIGLLLLLVLSLVYVLLKKKIATTSDSIDSVRKAQAALQEESLKLDEKLVTLFDTQLASQPLQQTEDHSLVLKISNELARMETNLSRMDASVKGHKQLSSAVKRIKENLSANGYEFVDMLGKPYHEGMVVDADFVTSEDLEDGQQIITGVTKPQVNFNGKMIQSAKITVSQNV